MNRPTTNGVNFTGLRSNVAASSWRVEPEHVGLVQAAGPQLVADGLVGVDAERGLRSPQRLESQFGGGRLGEVQLHSRQPRVAAVRQPARRVSSENIVGQPRVPHLRQFVRAVPGALQQILVGREVQVLALGQETQLHVVLGPAQVRGVGELAPLRGDRSEERVDEVLVAHRRALQLQRPVLVELHLVFGHEDAAKLKVPSDLRAAGQRVASEIHGQGIREQPTARPFVLPVALESEGRAAVKVLVVEHVELDALGRRRPRQAEDVPRRANSHARARRTLGPQIAQRKVLKSAAETGIPEERHAAGLQRDAPGIDTGARPLAAFAVFGRRRNLAPLRDRHAGCANREHRIEKRRRRKPRPRGRPPIGRQLANLRRTNDDGNTAAGVERREHRIDHRGAVGAQVVIHARPAQRVGPIRSDHVALKIHALDALRIKPQKVLHRPGLEEYHGARVDLQRPIPRNLCTASAPPPVRALSGPDRAHRASAPPARHLRVRRPRRAQHCGGSSQRRR